MRALRPVLAGLEALGHRTDAVLGASRIPASILEDPEQLLPAGSMSRFWDQAVKATGDEHLGLHLAQAAPIQAFEVHAYAMLSSPVLRDAFHRACRYQRLINEGTELSFTESTNVALLRHALPDGGSVPRQPAEFLVALWLRFGRLVTGTTWNPERVFFAHDRPSDTREHEAVFAAPIQFTSGQTALAIPAAVLAASNPRADPALAALLDRHAFGLLEQHPSLDSVSARVRAWLVEAHGAASPTAREAARALVMSERTLHRRLTEEDTTFRELLDRFRHEKAVSLLTSRRTSIAEVAFLLGYSEISAFYRAFRRWTGRSPAAVRDEAGAR